MANAAALPSVVTDDSRPTSAIPHIFTQMRPHPPRHSSKAAIRPELHLKVPAEQKTETKQCSQGSPASATSASTPALTPQTSFSSKSSPAACEAEPFPSFLRAFYDYQPSGPIEDDEQISITLAINARDMILVHSIRPNGWADGTLLKNGTRGWLPTNFCRSYEDELISSLLHALTNVWEFLRGQGDDLTSALLMSQDYVRGMIAGVRKLLEQAGCLNRDSEPVSSQQGIRVLRKGLLADLSSFAKRARIVQERCEVETVEQDALEELLEEVLLKAFKVVMRAVRFVDCWRQARVVKRAREGGVERGQKDAHPSSRQPLDPHTSRRDDEQNRPHDEHESATRIQPAGAADFGDSTLSASFPLPPSSAGGEPSHAVADVRPTSCENAPRSDHDPRLCDVSASLDSHTAESSDENPLLRHPSSTPHEAPISHRASATHRLSHIVKRETASSHVVLASDRLSSTHEAFLGLIGAIIGLHFQAKQSMELLVTTQQSLYACQALTNVVDEIWQRDFRRSGAVEASRVALHLRLAELVNATTDIIQCADASGHDAICLPQQSKRLMDAATACVRATGDCVAKSTAVIERTGDFEVVQHDVAESNQTAGSAATTTSRRSVSPEPRRHPSSKRSRRATNEVRSASPPLLHRRSRTTPEGTLPRSLTTRSHFQPHDPPPLPPVPDANMHFPSVGALRAKGTILRQPTVARRPSETGLRKAGSRAPRSTKTSTSKFPTLEVDIPQGSFFDTAITPPDLPDDQHAEGPPLSTCPTPREMVRHVHIADSPPEAHEHTDDGSSDSKSFSARNSGASAASHASTRATTPDQSAHKMLSMESLATGPDLDDNDPSTTTDSESQLLAETHAHELTFNRDGQVTGGSLPALIERLTAHDTTPDALFTNTFFLTFRLFTTPVDLAQCLIDRFEHVGDDQEFGAPVRLRVYNVFKQWMEGFWSVGADADAVRLIRTFADGQLRFYLPTASRRLLELSAYATGREQSLEHPRIQTNVTSRPRAFSGPNPSDATAPSPIVSKSQLNLLKGMKNGVSACNILDLDPLELARQFTIMQSRIFCAIQPEELLGSEWTRKHDSKAVNLKAMSALSTDLGNLVADTILQLELKKRAVVIKQWVKIACCCLELNNYDALMAIICSLNSSIVQRLKKTWDVVSPKTMAKFDYLKTIVDFARNYFVLRQRLQGHVAPCLPFVGIYLTDLTFVDCGNPATRQLPGSHDVQSVINFDKYIKTTKIISDLQRFQIPYKLAPVPEMQDWMEAQISRVRVTDQANVQNYYRRSLLLEPREASSAMQGQKQSPTDNTATSFGSTSSKESGKDSNFHKFEFFSGLGLSLNKEKSPN